MKIALPLTASDEFASHYGDAAKFEVYEVDREQRKVRRRLTVAPEASGPCAWPTLLRAAGVELVLAAGMGSTARGHMTDQGLEVLAGVPVLRPDLLVAAWLAGELQPGENLCDRPGTGPHQAGVHEHAGRCRCTH